MKNVSPLLGSIRGFIPLVAVAFAFPFSGKSGEGETVEELRGASAAPPADPPLGADQPRSNAGRNLPGPSRLAPAIPGNEDDQRRRQAQQAANVLRDQAEARARSESLRTGKTVEPEKTPTADEIFANPGEVSSDPQFSRGPQTAEMRLGESRTGPPSGVLARSRPVAEHLITNANPVPTINAPGLSADSGIKLTPDNLDARGGSGHDDGPDPADDLKTATNPNAFTGIPGVHSEERGDTAEKNHERMRKEASSSEATELQDKADEAVRKQTEANRAGAAPHGEESTGQEG